MKTFLLRNSRRATRASTYMTVVVTMIIVGVMLAAYIKMVGTQNTFATHSQTWNRSVAVLEAGVEEAMAHLNKNGSPDSGGTVNIEAWLARAGTTTAPPPARGPSRAGSTAIFITSPSAPGTAAPPTFPPSVPPATCGSSRPTSGVVPAGRFWPRLNCPIRRWADSPAAPCSAG